MTKRKQEQRYDYMVKLVIVGDSAVGKTNILLRFSQDQFKVNHVTTIGVDFKVKVLPIEGVNIKVQIWDTAGQQRFKTITQTYYKGAGGVIFVYSVTDRRSFQNIGSWMKQVSESNNQKISKIIVANKIDCKQSERQVSFEQGRKLAQQYAIPFLQVSAKDNINISKIFNDLAFDIKQRLSTQVQEGNKTNLIKLNPNIQSKKQGCQC